jgi:predicted Rossmann fold flavoprotein
MSSDAITKTEVIIIGGGAAGLMCAIECGKRGRQILVLERSSKIGEKIRISGGGRCNFTNLSIKPENYISENPRFCLSALKRYTQRDFINLIEAHSISYHEKKLGQLFCDKSSKLIVDMLTGLCRAHGVKIITHCDIAKVEKSGKYTVITDKGIFRGESLIIACGGKSIPAMGATGFGYDVATRFGLTIIKPRAGLVPLTFEGTVLKKLKALSGISVDVTVKCNKTEFTEAMLFTLRGSSGPEILQISSYWQPGEQIRVNLAPGHDIFEFLRQTKTDHPKQGIHTALSATLPVRLAKYIEAQTRRSENLADLPNKHLQKVAELVNNWPLSPTGTEGYRTAEVTVGGVDTRKLSSKTFECNDVKGLYFIGEVLDVTGHLGGYNFQWAWSSGWAAGQVA